MLTDLYILIVTNYLSTEKITYWRDLIALRPENEKIFTPELFIKTNKNKISKV